MYQQNEKLTIKGSESFTTAYITSLKNSLGDNVVDISREGFGANVVSTLSIDCETYFTGEVVDHLLAALSQTLVHPLEEMEDKTTIHFGKYLLKIHRDVIDAVRNEYSEITYILSYKLAQELEKEKAEKIVANIQRSYDTCDAYVHENRLIVDRYHTVTVAEPLPEEDISKLLVTTRALIKEFQEISAIECELLATGNYLR